jgi:hypothetical protein
VSSREAGSWEVILEWETERSGGEEAVLRGMLKTRGTGAVVECRRPVVL